MPLYFRLQYFVKKQPRGKSEYEQNKLHKIQIWLFSALYSIYSLSNKPIVNQYLDRSSMTKYSLFILFGAVSTLFLLSPSLESQLISCMLKFKYVFTTQEKYGIVIQFIRNKKKMGLFLYFYRKCKGNSGTVST